MSLWQGRAGRLLHMYHSRASLHADCCTRHLQHLRSQLIPGKMQARWAEEFALHNAIVKYIPGEKYQADALSRGLICWFTLRQSPFTIQPNTGYGMIFWQSL